MDTACSTIILNPFVGFDHMSTKKKAGILNCRGTMPRGRRPLAPPLLMDEAYVQRLRRRYQDRKRRNVVLAEQSMHVTLRIKHRSDGKDNTPYAAAGATKNSYVRGWRALQGENQIPPISCVCTVADPSPWDSFAHSDHLFLLDTVDPAPTHPSAATGLETCDLPASSASAEVLEALASGHIQDLPAYDVSTSAWTWMYGPPLRT